jgi:hypothetical protein
MLQTPAGLKIPLKRGKPTYFATIKQALNGYIVIVEEDNQLPEDSEDIPELEEQMETIMNAIQNAANGNENEIRRIIRENNKKKDKNETPKFKKVGIRVFPKFSEATAFLSFIFDSEDKEHLTIEDFLK